jgi:hypothetical protein
MAAEPLGNPSGWMRHSNQRRRDRRSNNVNNRSNSNLKRRDDRPSHDMPPHRLTDHQGNRGRGIAADCSTRPQIFRIKRLYFSRLLTKKVSDMFFSCKKCFAVFELSFARKKGTKDESEVHLPQPQQKKEIVAYLLKY